MKFKSYILLCLCLLFFKSKGGNNVQFFNLNEKYGISIRETNQVCEDKNGFIWVSSKMGILRYSRSDVRIYHLPYKNLDILTVKLEYAHNALFAYTDNGQIFKYNPILDKFEILINLCEKLRNNFLYNCKILCNNSANLWISTSMGLFRFSKKTGLKKLLDSESINHIEWKDNNHFFLAIKGRIKTFNIADGTNKDYYKIPEKDINIISLKYNQATGNLWIGTLSRGLYVIKNKLGRLKLNHIQQIPSQPVRAIENISDTTMFIGVDGQGLWEINKYKQQVLNVYKEDIDNPNALKGNGVYDIYCDKNNRIWICTYSGGVSFLEKANPAIKQIKHIANNHNSLVNDNVNDVLEDSFGNLWFATNNGISILNVKDEKWKTLFKNNNIHARVFLTLCEDKQGNIWAGTYSSGVYLINAKTGRLQKHLNIENTNGKIQSNFVFDIINDDTGNIWWGGVDSDLIYYNTKQDTIKSFKNITVKKLYNYSPEKLLICTTYGLLLFDKNTGKNDILVKHCLVYDIFLKDGIMWLCTSGNGVIRYNPQTREEKHFTVESGLPSNFITSIQYADGYFWIGTEQGLCRLNEHDKSVSTFNALSALNNVSFNPGARHLSKNGNLIYGTNKGALMFNPREIQPARDKGRIFIQELTISGRSIRETETPDLSSPLDSLNKLSLKYFQNTISLEMLPIGITSQGAKFSWKLDGLDEEWSIPSTNRILSYSNIASGTYTLHIRMYDSSTSKILAERTIRLNIIPPFWKTLWFKILTLIVVAGIAFFSLLYYINHLKKVHSEEKIRFFANTAHDMRTSLTLINGPIEELNKETNLSEKGLHFLHLATEQAHRLWKVVNQLMDFQKADIGKEHILLSVGDLVKIVENRIMMFESYAGSKNIDIKFSSNVSNFITAVDETIIDKIVDNLVSNAIKYSHPDSKIKVKLQCAPEKWVLKVKDYGIGISKKAQRQLFKEYYRAENVINAKIVGSGIGLLLVKNYVTLHGGKITCHSQLNTGATFQIIMPVKKVNLSSSKPQTAFSKDPLPVIAQQEFSPSALKDEAETYPLKMKVLIVEDNEYLREFLKSAMEPQFRIYQAEDGLQAWELIKKQTPDMVVSDIMMPHMDGFELCKKIKSTYETSHLPVILLTALSGRTEQLQGLGLGADDYLTKPFDVSILRQRIRTVVQNRETVREKTLKIHSQEDTVISGNELNDKFLKQMLKVVNNNMATPQFSKNDFARTMNVSPSLLYKKVKALTNLSPTDFIKTVRLKHARELLQQKKYNITEISELCGFSSVGYFSTVFRKHYGKSPSQIVG